jgi:hypothetical protein
LDQLIPRHRRIDIVDPTQNSAGEVSNLRQPGIRELLGGKPAANSDLAVENRFSAFVEARDFIGDAIERDESRPGYVANVPLERLSHVDDLQIIAGGKPIG